MPDTSTRYTKAENNWKTLGRQGRPEEVADAVAWLANEGAGYVSGTVIDVDGGLVRA